MGSEMCIRDSAITSLVFTMLPYIALLLSFTTFLFMDEVNVLTAEKAFVTLSYMGQLSMQIISLPMIIVSIIQANVSLKRINKFMNSEELDDKDAVEHDPTLKDVVEINDGCFKWGMNDSHLTLEDININIPKGRAEATSSFFTRKYLYNIFFWWNI